MLTRLSHGREIAGVKTSYPLTLPCTLLMKGMSFYGCISTTLCPRKDLSKLSKAAGQSNAADLFLLRVG